MPELLGWSVELKRQESEVREEEEKPFTRELQLINHLNAVIAQLVETNKAQSERIAELEKRVPVGGAVAPQAGSTPDTITDRADLSLALDTPMKPIKPKVRAASKTAAATWFEWYTKTPRIWEVCDDHQYKSQSKQIVAFMKLFLPLGFSLDPTTGEYADHVMQAGNTARQNMHEFLQARGIKRKFGSGLLKQLRALHRDGALDKLITRYRASLALGQIADPAPETTKEYF
ncbi:hypothetical protein PF004_g18845 [Phytophthora fragariae]|nr:hypothetical protein PF004_g18845 [Phytophthora fragariae]